MASVQMFVALMTLDLTPAGDMVRPLEYLTVFGGRGKRCNLLSIIPLYVPGARPGRQGLEIIEEKNEQSRGKGRTMEEREERDEQ